MNNFIQLIYLLIINRSFCVSLDNKNLILINNRNHSFSDNNNNLINSIQSQSTDQWEHQHGQQNDLSTNARSSERQGRWFPFYTIGRFQNTVCMGSNSLAGTCVLMGECSDAGGIATGGCTTLTRQAICCVYQQACGTTTSNNNTYFVNPGFPGSWTGGSGCSVTINPCSDAVCQLKISLLDLSLAPPNGDGICGTDALTITGGATSIPVICGENSGQHIYVNFDDRNPVQISVSALSSYTFGRHWHIQVSQINCDSQFRAPEGCLQYYTDTTGVVRSFNYSPSPSASLNSVGLEGTRQLANSNYGICVRTAPDQCSITWSPDSSTSASFTITGDVDAVAPSLLGNGALQEQQCTTDYVIIPNPIQMNVPLASDRFCGLGLNPTTSNARPFVLYVITDDNEALDILNRGFALSYSQNACPI